MADKATGTRAKPKPRPVYVVMQITDGEGNPVEFDKARVDVLAGSKETEAVLDALEANPHAFSKKIEL